MKINSLIEKILEDIQQPLWEHWYIKEKLGSGAYSCVFKVEAKRSAHRINKAALKIQPITANGREFVNEEDKRAYIERQRVRTDREAEIMCNLRRFPNVVFYEDEDIRELIIDGKFEGYYSLLRMELLTSVVDLIRKKTFDFSQKNIVKLACDIGRGIADAHSIGVIHRDIKPDNFFVDDYGTYKIGDFNVAKISDAARTMAGTPGYIAPEVYRAKSEADAVYTGQADIYSFGICLYRLTNDMLYPFEDKFDTEESHMKRYRGEKLLPPRHADEKFSKIILKACEFSPDDRYHEMGDMLRDLFSLDGSEIPVYSAAYPQSEKKQDPNMTILAEESASLQSSPESQASSVKTRTPCKVGSTIIFGSYPQTKSGDCLPLKWRVLSVENNMALLITENIIDGLSFSDDQNSPYWANSSIRGFLNGEFIDKAFSENEKQAILDSSLMNYKNVTFRTKSGEKTSDKVYLLSIEEADRLFFDDDDRKASPTEYAVSKGLFTTADGKSWWWLRSSGVTDLYGADIDYGGDIDSYGSDRTAAVSGLRPVVRVSLEYIETLDSNDICSNTIYTTLNESLIAPSELDVGDTVSFGSYFYDTSGVKMPLMWRVLKTDGDKALLITDECIDAMNYDLRSMPLTWRQSEIRKWLNTYFLDEAIGTRSSKLTEVKCSTGKNKVYSTGGGLDTADKVFLLSLDEAEEYFSSNSSRMAFATPYAKSKGAFADETGYTWWWLRSPGCTQKYAANVDYGGDVDFYGSDYTAVNAVRPVVFAEIRALKRQDETCYL